MSVAGWYLEARVRDSMPPYFKLYGECVMRDIMPAFNEISARATKVADDEYHRLCKLPMGENTDGSELAEAAQSAGATFYSIMDGLRQGTLNLYTVGLFHSLEQQLYDLCCDATYSSDPPKDTELALIAKWYKTNFRIDLKTLDQWNTIDEIRCAANTIKHGDGSSAKRLRMLCPSLFENPQLKEYLGEWGSGLTLPIRSPMAGEDIFVTPEVFTRFIDSVQKFVMRIAEHFHAHRSEEFL